MRKPDQFRRLHQSGCFVIPNPWDIGSARLLAGLGFPALATTSSGFAWSMGRRDNHVSIDQALDHFRSIAASVDLPVNGDFEGGFAVEPEGVGANVSKAAMTGVAGLSIEDSTGDPAHPLLDLGLAVERIRAAREAIDKSKMGVLLPAARKDSSLAAPISRRPSGGWLPTPERERTVCMLQVSGPAPRSPRWCRQSRQNRSTSWLEVTS